MLLLWSQLICYMLTNPGKIHSQSMQLKKRIGHFWQLNYAQIQRIAIHLWKVVKESPRDPKCIFRHRTSYIWILYGKFSVLFAPAPENFSLCPLKLNDLEELNDFFNGTSHEWLPIWCKRNLGFVCMHEWECSVENALAVMLKFS